MRLSDREQRAFKALQEMPTGKLVICKFGGEIKSIVTEVDELLADKAEAQKPTAREAIRTQEIAKPDPR